MPRVRNAKRERAGQSRPLPLLFLCLMPKTDSTPSTIPLPAPLLLSSVPTVPPGNVHAEATNSTTIRFTWNAPSPQFINGINQGYKVREASPRPPEEGWGFSEGDRRPRSREEGRDLCASEIIGSSQADDT